MATIIDTISTYSAWNTVRFAASFYGFNGALADPSTVVLMVCGSNGVVTQFNPTRDSVGTYHYDYYTATPGGRWYYRFVGTGAVNASSGDTPFNIQIPQF